jgi:hypothetical protein
MGRNGLSGITSCQAYVTTKWLAKDYQDR